MSKIRIAINGFGRIGRVTFRKIQERSNMEVVAINDITDSANLAHLLKYDSVHGKFDGIVEAKENSIMVNGREVQITSVKDPAELGWGELGVSVVVEATGIFRMKESNKGGYGDHT